MCSGSTVLQGWESWPLHRLLQKWVLQMGAWGKFLLLMKFGGQEHPLAHLPYHHLPALSLVSALPTGAASCLDCEFWRLRWRNLSSGHSKQWKFQPLSSSMSLTSVGMRSLHQCCFLFLLHWQDPSCQVLYYWLAQTSNSIWVLFRFTSTSHRYAQAPWCQVLLGAEWH